MDYYSSLDSRSLNSTPTIFEIISSKELNQLLSPSIRYIIVHYAQKYPRYLLKLALNFDELNLVFKGLLEYHFLKNWNSTFTDKFYGLKRVSKNKIDIKDVNNQIFEMVETKKRLNKVQIWLILLNMVGGDYLQEKLEVLFEKYKTENLINKFTSKNWKYWFLKIYPLVQSSFGLLNVLFQILYLAGKTKTPNFTDYLLKVEYARLSQFDYDLNDKTKKSSSDDATIQIKPNLRSRPPTFGQHLSQISRNYTRPIQSIISSASTTIFPSAIFFLKFLEWWNSSEFATKLTKNSQNVLDKTIPSPISLIRPNTTTTKKLLKSHQNSKKCPICHEDIHNPAIIETGYVFCYKCIFTYLSECDEANGGRCPISGVKLLNCKYLNDRNGWKVDGIRRLMI